MKFRNKATKEIRKAEMRDDGIYLFSETAEEWRKCDWKVLAKYWEEYEEEPKEYWYIDPMVCGVYYTKIKKDEDLYEFNKQIGNYFGTKEEAELAVRKLKAWKWLKDKGFRFNGKEIFSEGLLEIDGVLPVLKGIDNAERLKIIDDLDLLFGGEE